MKMTMADRIAVLIGTWFGCGYAPVAPGTAGSAAALGIAIGLVVFAGWKAWYFAVLAALMLAPSIWAAGVTARVRGEKDPGVVVVDEVIGQWVALAGAASLSRKSYLGAFTLFRLFD